MEVHFDAPPRFKKTLALVSFPTTGLPGTIASQFLIEKMDLPLIGTLHGDGIPPMIMARRGQWEPPVAIYGKSVPCGPERMCDGLLVATSVAPLDGAEAWQAAKALLDVLEPLGTRLVTVLESVAVEEAEEQDEVYAVAQGPFAAKTAKRLKLPTFRDGIMGGVSSALLVEGRRRGKDVLVLIAEAHEGHPDHKSAARLTQIVNEELMGTRLNIGPLEKEAAKIEEEITRSRRAAVMMKQRAMDASASMYR